jgi:hypothetical protein
MAEIGLISSFAHWLIGFERDHAVGKRLDAELAEKR